MNTDNAADRHGPGVRLQPHTIFNSVRGECYLEEQFNRTCHDSKARVRRWF